MKREEAGRDASGARIWFDLEPDARFFEFGSYGPAALASPSRPQLPEGAVGWYTPVHVLGGWEPG